MAGFLLVGSLCFPVRQVVKPLQEAQAWKLGQRADGGRRLSWQQGMKIAACMGLLASVRDRTEGGPSRPAPHLDLKRCYSLTVKCNGIFYSGIDTKLYEMTSKT